MSIKERAKQIEKRNKFKSQYKRRHSTYRYVSRPKRLKLTESEKHVQKPFFPQDTYNSIKPLFTAWVYARNIFKFCIPAFIFHGITIGFTIFSIIMLRRGGGDVSEAVGVSAVFGQFVLVAYAICLFFAIRRAKDHMAYYRIDIIPHKYNINRAFEEKIAGGLHEDEEATMLDDQRRRFNKYILFPSKREIFLIDQYRKDLSESNHIFYMIRLESKKIKNHQTRLSIENREEEHKAAKSIADLKQITYGGPNEYDEMVSKYKKRMAPNLRYLIQT